MATDQSVDSTKQLEQGSVLLHNDTLYIVERSPSPAGDVVVGELGSREVKSDRIFDVGDSCPLPTCDGEVVETDSARRRHCSEDCLEWIRTVPADGDDCPNYSCDDGTAIVTVDGGSYRRECMECSVFAGGRVHWREVWWPYTEEKAVEQFRSVHTEMEQGHDRNA